MHTDRSGIGKDISNFQNQHDKEHTRFSTPHYNCANQQKWDE